MFKKNRWRDKLIKNDELHRWYQLEHNAPRAYWCSTCNIWGEDRTPVYIQQIRCLKCGGPLHRGEFYFIQGLIEASNSDTPYNSDIIEHKIKLLKGDGTVADTTVNTQIEPPYTKHFLKSKTMLFSIVVALLGAILELDELQAFVDLLPGEGPAAILAVVASIYAFLRAVTVSPVRFRRK